MTDRSAGRTRTRLRRVHLAVRAVATSLRHLRLVVADLLAMDGFTVAGVERGVLVADELAAVLISSVEVPLLHVEIDHAPGVLRLRGRVTPSDGVARVPDLGAIAREVLDAGVGDAGEWHVSSDHDALGFDAVLIAEPVD